MRSKALSTARKQRVVALTEGRHAHALIGKTGRKADRKTYGNPLFARQLAEASSGLAVRIGEQPRGIEHWRERDIDSIKKQVPFAERASRF